MGVLPLGGCLREFPIQSHQVNYYSNALYAVVNNVSLEMKRAASAVMCGWASNNER